MLHADDTAPWASLGLFAAKLPDSKLEASALKKMREAGYNDVVMHVCHNNCQYSSKKFVPPCALLRFQD